MADSALSWNDRIARLESLVGPVDLFYRGRMLAENGQNGSSQTRMDLNGSSRTGIDQNGSFRKDATPNSELIHAGNSSSIASVSPDWITVTSSRLGRQTQRHRQACRFLTRSLLDCRQRNGTLLVTIESAIEHWAWRTAELFGVRALRLWVDEAPNEQPPENDRSADIVVRPRAQQTLSRDAVAIGLADRVDAVFVRRGGNIERAIRRRMDDRDDASTRVAVSGHDRCAAPGLIARGAIGLYFGSDEVAPPQQAPPQQALQGLHCTDEWTRAEGEWLIHCTRGCEGAWPGETERQYRDAIILGEERNARRAPLDSLARIIGAGRIIAGTTATSKQYPVVCFSELSLMDLLARRCYRSHLGRWDYEPYGVAIRRRTGQTIGAQSVIYGQPGDRSKLCPSRQFLFHPVGKTSDWREEREWRVCATVDLQKIESHDVRVFSLDTVEARERLQYSPWPVSFLAASPSTASTILPSNTDGGVSDA